MKFHFQSLAMISLAFVVLSSCALQERVVLPEQEFNTWKTLVLGEGTNSGGSVLPEKGSPDTRNTVVFLGDSLTAGSGLPPSAAYPYLLGQYWKSHGINLEFVNAARGGWTSANALSALEPYLSDKTALVFLEIGANDILNEHWPVKFIKKNIQEIITRCKAKGIPVALAAIVLDPQTNSYQAEVC